MAGRLVIGSHGPEWIDTTDISGFDDLEVYGKGGNDGIWGSGLADRLFGGDGNDLLEDYGGVNTLYG